MSGAEADPPDAAVDEFDQIERLFRPLTGGAAEALGLQDDAAVIRPVAGQDLVVSKDAIVEGVHFLPEDPLDGVARKLLRVNLSDAAAMGSTPFAYFLAVAWPPRCGWREREAFAAGLAADQQAFGVTLLGGDTVSTPGPLTASLTVLAWAPTGSAVRRSGARPGDRVLVSGVIGDGVLGLWAAQGRLAGVPADAAEALAGRYRLPDPRLELAEILRDYASAAADVSDGLVADLGNIARASGVAAALHLERLPVSPGGRLWLQTQSVPARGLATLATGGDDYEIVCTASPENAARIVEGAAARGVAVSDVGEMAEGQGVRVLHDGQETAVNRAGWRHG